MMEYKPTFGIALCRYNIDRNKQSEILMIKKRYTYQYFNFVYGKYRKNDDLYLQYLFDNMTVGEKIEIMSMNFSKMWYRIFLIDYVTNYNISSNFSVTDHMIKYNSKMYIKKKSKFETYFLTNMTKLQSFIKNSTNNEIMWEIPKGHMEINKQKTNELPLDCAKREFEEETNISDKEYKILWDVEPISVNHVDDDIKFTSSYFIAIQNNTSNIQPVISMSSYHQLIEIENIKWVSIQDIQLLGLNKKYTNILYKTFTLIISVFKKNVKSYYYS